MQIVSISVVVVIDIDFAVGHRTCTPTGQWLDNRTNYTQCVFNYPLLDDEVHTDLSDSLQVCQQETSCFILHRHNTVWANRNCITALVCLQCENSKSKWLKPFQILMFSRTNMGRTLRPNELHFGYANDCICVLAVHVIRPNNCNISSISNCFREIALQSPNSNIKPDQWDPFEFCG